MKIADGLAAKENLKKPLAKLDIRLTEDMKDRLSMYAKRKGVSVTALVKALIEKELS